MNDIPKPEAVCLTTIAIAIPAIIAFSLLKQSVPAGIAGLACLVAGLALCSFAVARSGTN